MYVLEVWLRRRATIAPRIENLHQLEQLCESDTDRELWQCLVECIVEDLAIDAVRIPDFHAEAWRNGLHALKWRLGSYESEYPIHKSEHWLRLDQVEDSRDSAEYRLADEINLFLQRVFEGKEIMTATKSKPKDPKTLEHLDAVIKRSLSPGAELSALKGKEATDDELLVAIKQAWRRPLVTGRRKYTVSTTHPTWDTAIWIDTISQTGDPVFSSKGGLVRHVRDLLNINWTDQPTTKLTKVEQELVDMGLMTHPDKQFDSIKRKGKSRAVPHPATTSTSTPAGILANDPEAGQDDDDGRAEIGPIDKFQVRGLFDSPYQTRGEPDDAWLQELAASMQAEGQLQPCLIRPTGEIIGGHTRWRAAKLLKWHDLDVRIVKCDDATARRLVLIDNAKRKDLSDRERCQAYCDLVEDYKSRGKTQAQVATKLGIDETTLSNIVRLRSIPEVLWKRYEAKGLSIEQLRALSVHGDRPKFVTAFVNYLEKNVFCKIDEQPENNHFSSALERGIESAFRPMSKDSWGRGCVFKPTDEEKQQLEIIEVKRRFGGVQKMAANTNLWNKLQKAAKKKLKDKEAAKETAATNPKALKAAARAEAEHREAMRLEALEECWHVARSQAIVAKFTSPKKQDYPAALRLRMFMCQEDHWRESVDLDVLISPETEFMEQICDDVRRWFDAIGGPNCEFEVLGELVEWLGLDPVKHFTASSGLLERCTAEELQEIANEFDLPEDQTANDLAEVLAEKWPPGLVPNQFCLEQEKPKPKPKKA